MKSAIGLQGRQARLVYPFHSTTRQRGSIDEMIESGSIKTRFSDGYVPCGSHARSATRAAVNAVKKPEEIDEAALTASSTSSKP